MKRKLIPWFVIQCIFSIFLLAIFGFCLYWTIVMIGSNQNATSFPIHAFVPHLLFVTVLLTPLLATSIIHIRLFVRKDLDSETFQKQMRLSFFWQLAALVAVGGVFVFAAILGATGQHFLSIMVFDDNAWLVFSIIVGAGLYPAAYCFHFKPAKKTIDC